MQNIKNFFLFGGSISLVEAAILLKKKKQNFFVYTSKRQLEDHILDNSLTLKSALKKNKIVYKVCKNINKDKFFIRNFDKNSLGIGFGEPWKFNNGLIKKFRGQLIDFMCIPLPLFRGGAHYTWMSLMGVKKSSICLQEITENTIQGIFDDGQIILKKNFLIKNKLKPSSYFFMEKKYTRKMFNYFFNLIIKKKFFLKSKVSINECNSLFLPRLLTCKNGFVNWEWRGEEILRFINAFDDPYKGCSTRYIDNKNSKLVFIKDASWYDKKMKFHIFQSGLIINKIFNSIIVATKDGSIRINVVLNISNQNIINNILVGKRFYSTYKDLELGKSFIPNYNS